MIVLYIHDIYVTLNSSKEKKCEYFEVQEHDVIRLVSQSLMIHSNPGGGHRTGSYPEPPNGLHLMRRHAVNTVPLETPNVLYASIAYAEHVGKKRQAGGRRGDIAVL